MSEEATSDIPVPRAPVSRKINPVLKSSDMPDDMQSKVFDLAEEAMNANKKAVDIAASLKKSMDKLYGSTWHCIVGKNFGSFVSHESGYFVYFYVDSLAFLLFKTA
ncbi:hypothetical protein FOA43_001705 [Brettanomyces nanus]|uniref:Dynein light chain n=1 Tax=Eeniella nana TaxID=13502 RepID=A0A875S081_EENNA|nr:uncharacterized protein FOA43_001705 [Brettanomyces nanus]QPG74378.1 hypothetical protein FOA43_001705 [Brettanomyces nanus]